MTTEVQVVTKTVVPSETAVKFWLEARKPDEWKTSTKLLIDPEGEAVNLAMPTTIIGSPPPEKKLKLDS